MIPYFLDHEVKIVKACKYIIYKAGGPQTYTAWLALGETGPKALDPLPNKIAYLGPNPQGRETKGWMGWWWLEFLIHREGRKELASGT